MNLVPRRGVLIAWDGHPNVDECVARALSTVERYGFHANSTWRVGDVGYRPGATRWTVLRDGRPWAEFEFSLAGEYNVLNATAAAAMAAHYGISVDAIAEALRSFRSVKRRLEVRSDAYGITIIDDFAHHPTAIAQTLKALRARYAGRRLWAILEPRSNTLRRRVFQRELSEALGIADQVVIAAIFKSEAIRKKNGFIRKQLSRISSAAEFPRSYCPAADEIVDAVAPRLVDGDVVAILSNGGFGGIYEKLPARLRKLLEVTAKA